MNTWRKMSLSQLSVGMLLSAGEFCNMKEMKFLQRPTVYVN